MSDARNARCPAQASGAGLYGGAPQRDSPPVVGGLPMRLVGRPDSDELVALVNRHLGHARRHLSALTLLSVLIEGAGRPGIDAAHASHAAAITEAGRRLRARMRADDEVWQTGEREFVVLLPDVRNAGAVAAQRRLVMVLGGNYRVESVLVTLAARIGIASYPAIDGGAEPMLSAAIQARDLDLRGAELRRG